MGLAAGWGLEICSSASLARRKALRWEILFASAVRLLSSSALTRASDTAAFKSRTLLPPTIFFISWSSLGCIGKRVTAHAPPPVFTLLDYADFRLTALDPRASG